MMKKITFIICCIIAVYACNKEEIMIYDSGRYIQFEDTYKDTTTSSFFFYPDQTSFQLPMVLKLIGDTLENNLNYKLEISTEYTDAPTNSYALEPSFVFEKGNITDTTYITFNKVTEFETKEFKVVVDVVSTDDLLVGETIYSRKAFKISSMISQPSWWDDVFTDFYLGVYSEKKFRAFIDITGIGDLTGWEDWRLSEICLQFKYELIKLKEAGTPLLMEDGTDMLSTVKIIG